MVVKHCFHVQDSIQDEYLGEYEKYLQVSPWAKTRSVILNIYCIYLYRHYSIANSICLGCVCVNTMYIL